jgi:26S proteasome regulatory subunit (ATPase 3-interacting protein)
MAPRKPKPDDDTSSTTSELPPVLKPKTDKAKVMKPKADKPKPEKVKGEKVDRPRPEKPKAVKKEKADGDRKGEKGEGGGKKVGEKEKVKAVNGEEAVEIMARYLREQNRPYSATEVSANLHGKASLSLSLLEG